jgi:O-antigen/teichoic acid export membrane protein
LLACLCDDIIEGLNLEGEIKSVDTLIHIDTRKVFFWKGVEYVGLFLFLVLIPRTMGAKLYGDFAIMLSILGVFILSNALGGLPIFGRFIPEFKASNQTVRIQGLFTQFFIFRLLISLVLFAFLFFSLTHFRPDFDMDTIIVLCATCVLGTISLSCTHLFYGLNKMPSYLFHDSSSRLLLVLIMVGYLSNLSLQTSVYALGVVEVILVVVLLFLARKYFSFYAAVDQFPDFYKHLKFGLAFFASNLILMVVFRTGEILISFFTSASEEVAYYHLSNAMFLALYALFSQVSTVLIPSINTLHSLGEYTKRDKWLGIMFVYLTVITVLTLIMINSVGEPMLLLLLGQSFSEVAVNFCIISISLIPLSVVRLGYAVAMVNSKPKENFLVASIAMLSFLLSAVILIPTMAAKGASFAVVISSLIAAVFSYYHFKLWKIINTTKVLKIFGVGAICIGMIEFSGYSRIEVGFFSLVFFISMMFLLQVVKVSEVQAMAIGQNKKKGKV